jgi:Kdo2-lipid IVA lauroyltransferase/acyltransferase
MGSINQKALKRDFARNVFYFFRAVFRILPYGFIRAFSRFIISVAFFFVRSKQRIARESLDIAFGNTLPEKEKQRIIRECFSSVGRGMIELLYASDHPESIRDNFFFEGKEHLDAALKEGKGVILVSAHFGNFPLMLLRLVQEGYATSGIMRPARDEIIEKDFLAIRDKFKVKTIYSLPRTTAVRQSLQALRNNELLFIPLDQNFGTKGGVFVNFFGRPAATATGPAVFAMRTGAPIVPIFTMRDGGERHKIIVEPPFHIEEKENDEATIYACTAKITEIIERYIRKYPQEWGWMHRRWKTKPKQEAPDAGESL